MCVGAESSEQFIYSFNWYLLWANLKKKKNTLAENNTYAVINEL
jgi:hypothetical protein